MTCRFCACALDEAVEVRARLIRLGEENKRKEQDEFDAMHAKTQQDPEWV